jgi:Haloacid dehalogenase-like hydrolase
MAIEALVCDASGTLLDARLNPQPGVANMLARLKPAGVQVVVAANHPERDTRRQLQAAGLLDFVDHIVAREHVTKDKGSPVWVDKFRELTGLEANQFFYLGNSLYDMVTATRGPMVYAHSAWSGTPPYPYGLVAPAPGWVAAVTQHIFRKRHNWYWTLHGNDPSGRGLHAVTMIDADGAGGDQRLRNALLNLLKDDTDSALGPMTLKEFVMLHMLASLNNEGDFAAAQLWTTYPGHLGGPNNVMGDFLDVAAKLARNKYKRDLLERHTHAERSNVVYRREGIAGAVQNQLQTMRVGAAFRKSLKGKRVLLLDNFLTWGSTTETGRNLLLTAGAAAVKVACVGKYGTRMFVVGAPARPWDPFGTSPPQAASFRYEQRTGSTDPAALREFAASHAAMARERW